MTRRRSSIFVVAVFAIGLSLPLAQQLSDLIPTVAVTDNRALNPFPPLTPVKPALAAFAGRFEAWYADHMGLRGALVTGYRYLTDAVLRSPDKVMIGRDDWLYLRRGVREDIRTVPLVRDWCGRFAFSERQLATWVRVITSNQRWLAHRGIDYLFVVPPNKMTVLPQHLPARIHCRRGETRLTQLRRALRERSGITLLTPIPALERASARDVPIWYRTDTHWSPRGVLAAYPSVMKRIQALAPGATRITAFRQHARGRDFGDLGRLVQGVDVASDILWTVEPASVKSRPAPNPFPDQADAYGRRSSAREIPGGDQPRALVFHDSFFAGTMNTLLAESFARTVFVHHGRPAINRELVEKVQPDIVIHEMVERNLLHPFFR